MLTPDKEQQVINAVLAIGSFETEQSIRAEGNHAIRRVLNCSADEAQKILDDLQTSKLIEPDITRGGQLDARQPMPIACWRWSRPSRQI